MVATRRSSRLQSRRSGTQEPAKVSHPIARLSSLVERDQTPTSGAQSTLDLILSAPTPPQGSPGAAPTSVFSSPSVRTPSSASRIKPSLEEMHPSKVQQSTVKKPRSAIPTSVQKTPTSVSRLMPPRDEMHPSKIQQSTAKKPTSAERLGFVDIDTTSPVKANVAFLENTPTKAIVSLGPPKTYPGFEFKFGQRDSDLSTEAQRIMDSVREEALRIKNTMKLEQDVQDRKDSEAEDQINIARRRIAKPKGRFSDAHSAQFQKMDSIAGHPSAFRATPGRFHPVATSLKRTRSKADINDTEQSPSKSRVARMEGNHLEQTSPTKRVKHQRHEDASTARPISRDSQQAAERKCSGSAIPRSKSSNLLASITTPTKASLARAASVKAPKTSMIPSLSRSNTMAVIPSPVAPRTEGSNKASSIPKFNEIKSILRRPRRLFSNDPVKIAAGTHIPHPKSPGDINKELPSLPPSSAGPPPNTLKKVDFTPSTKSRHELAANSSSPSKMSSHVHFSSPLKAHQDVQYPSLPELSPPRSAPQQSRQPVPRDFTFRSSRQITFKDKRSMSPTIRQVRPSGMPTPLIPFQNMPVFPHGMSNKKRKHAKGNDDDIDIENKHEDLAEEGRRNKRVRVRETPQSPSPVKRVSRTPKSAKGKGRSILSLSRLNLLARPKERR
ncbi:MAG: hypothetical protein M1834_009648 [Cirrosporium novae-zelandiae]|nr:MAG: hypothetical protein M1834_009648 [Cirrosporium novae-zelandiae]